MPPPRGPQRPLLPATQDSASGLPGLPLASMFPLQAHLWGARLAGGKGDEGRGLHVPRREQLSAGVPVPTSPGTPWSRGEQLSAKPLRARSETPPPTVLPQPTREAAKKLQGPHPARQMGRVPRAAPSQVLTGSEDRSLHPDAGAALWSTFSVMCAFYREKPQSQSNAMLLPSPLSNTHSMCQEMSRPKSCAPGTSRASHTNGVPQHTFLQGLIPAAWAQQRPRSQDVGTACTPEWEAGSVWSIETLPSAIRAPSFPGLGQVAGLQPTCRPPSLRHLETNRL